LKPGKATLCTNGKYRCDLCGFGYYAEAKSIATHKRSSCEKDDQTMEKQRLHGNKVDPFAFSMVGSRSRPKNEKNNQEGEDHQDDNDGAQDQEEQDVEDNQAQQPHQPTLDDVMHSDHVIAVTEQYAQQVQPANESKT
jgi:hypothetical protein